MRAVTTLSVVVLAAAGIGHAVVSSLDADIARVDPFKDMKNRPRAGHGMNVLLVGTDAREKISEAERRKYRLGGAPCHCTDTMMIVHISEDRQRASVVSLPRDSYAETPPHTDRTTGRRHGGHVLKLNAAYAEGGPNLTVRTVEHMTRVKIDHYLEIDFTSFMKTVDVLGGVEICTTRPLKDSYTGLDLSAGTHELGGGEALQYVRSRHADGSSDLGRMQRQQRFMAALIAQSTSSGVLLNPMKFRDITRAVLGSVRADKEFGTGELLDLGRAMRNFSPSSSEFTTVPIGRMGYAVKGIGSTLKWDDAKAQAVPRPARGRAAVGAPRGEEQGRGAGTGGGGPAADPRPGRERDPHGRAGAEGGPGAGRDRVPDDPGAGERGGPGDAAHGDRVRPPVGPFGEVAGGGVAGELASGGAWTGGRAESHGRGGLPGGAEGPGRGVRGDHGGSGGVQVSDAGRRGGFPRPRPRAENSRTSGRFVSASQQHCS